MVDHAAELEEQLESLPLRKAGGVELGQKLNRGPYALARRGGSA